MSLEEYDKEGPFLLGKRELEDGRVLRLHQMVGTNTRLTLAPDGQSPYFEAMYCYHDREAAFAALEVWDGTGDPEGWYRHIETGRRRPDSTPASEERYW